MMTGVVADGLEDLDQRLLLLRISHKFSRNAHYLNILSYGEHILFTDLGRNTVFYSVLKIPIFMASLSLVLVKQCYLL